MNKHRYIQIALYTLMLIDTILINASDCIADGTQNTSVGKSNPEFINTGTHVATMSNPNTPPRVYGDIILDSRGSEEQALKKMGVSDFNTENLIRILDSNELSIKKMHVAWLLRDSNDVNAIPALERALGDDSDYVKIAASQALLKMGSKKAIPVLEKMCVEYSKEYEAGNRKNLNHLKRAAENLADAGEVSAIPYLRQIVADHNEFSMGGRITALRAFSKLTDKDPNVINDINRMKNDEDPQVRKEAEKFMKKIEAKHTPITEPNNPPK